MADDVKAWVEAGFGTTARSRWQRVETAAEGFSFIIAAAVMLSFAVWAWSASRGTRLAFDELLELAAATAPTRGQVLASLAEGVDFNPPLSHFAIRYSMALLGNSEMAARLPAFLGFATLLICLYAYVSRELGRSYGVLAMLVVLCSPVREYAVQARPYGLVLGLTGLILVLYRLVGHQSTRSFALLGMAFCAAALTASHYYAVLVIAVLLCAEGFRAYERKRLDWQLLLCSATPPIAVLWLLHDAIRRQRLQLTHYFSRGNLLSFDHGYDFLAVDPLVYCLALVLLAGFLAFVCAAGKPPVAVRVLIRPRLSEMALAIGLLLLPIIGAFATQFVTHAYVPRYFLPAALGFAVCLCYVLRWFSAVVPGVTIFAILAFSLGFGKAVLQEIHRPPETLPASGTLAAAWAPVLFDTPEAYLQMCHYNPGVRDRLWVIADPAASLRYRGYDTDDRIMLALAGRGRAQAVTLSGAVRRWPHFSLVPRSADSVWALKCISQAGAPVAVEAPFGDSNFIFGVTITPESIGRIDACASPAP